MTKKNLKTKSKIKSNLREELKGKTVLVTGGAGSIGSELTKKLLQYPVKAVRVLDINEHTLFRLGRSIKDSRLRLLLGSVLDKDRIELAGVNTDIVIHTAAIKNIEISEYNPIETIDVNVNGTINMMKMVLRNKPQKFLNVSTDKAVEPSTLYGATKQLCERLTSWAGGRYPPTKFATIRFGNVIESRGNVFEIWETESKNNVPLSITNPDMKRYFFHLGEATDFILQCLPLMKNGEIFVPKMKLFKIKDVASKFSKKHNVIGLRRGEKMEEILMTKNEKALAKQKNDMWIIHALRK